MRKPIRFEITDFRPKARPRAGQYAVYLPYDYKKWKLSAIAELEEQMFLRGRGQFPIQRANVKIELHGPSRADPDNAAGGVLDALVTAGVLADDRLTNIPHLVVAYNPSSPKRKAIVTLYEL